jgi:Glycosyltransferase family 10 (fucosyltransferase) C-term
LHSDCSSHLSSLGTVPVYLGDASHLKALLPHPKAAIFVADFNNNYTQLAEYLTYLSNNETAYESHREWRKTFTYEGNIKNNPLLQSSWYCDVCRWAIKNAARIGSHKNDAVCLQEERTNHFSASISHFEGMAVRTSSSHEIFLVANSTLRLIPDMDTLDSLHFQADDAVHVSDAELKKCVRGEPMPPIGEWTPSIVH